MTLYRLSARKLAHGMRVAVYWAKDRLWYPGYASCFDMSQNRRQMAVIYQIRLFCCCSLNRRCLEAATLDSLCVLMDDRPGSRWHGRLGPRRTSACLDVPHPEIPADAARAHVCHHFFDSCAFLPRFSVPASWPALVVCWVCFWTLGRSQCCPETFTCTGFQRKSPM